ncbi:MAG: spore maturation protein [Ruminococcus sp.]|nr:spore maturation protein [Ruminococcus sp.]
MTLSEIIVPVIICLVFVFALIKRVDIFSEFVHGAKENLLIAIDLIPPLVILLTAIEMLSVSGTIDALSDLLSPVTSFLGFPKECTSLALIRPVSGSGALAALESLFQDISPDSYEGRVASVLMGSSETTFYTIAVYYSAARIKAEYKVFVSSLTADFTCFVFSALIVRLFY